MINGAIISLKDIAGVLYTEGNRTLKITYYSGAVFEIVCTEVVARKMLLGIDGYMQKEGIPNISHIDE